MILRERVIRLAERAAILVLLSLGAFLILLPMVWGFLSSLKPTDQILRIPLQWLPRTLVAENYLRPLRELNFPRYFLNSLVVATGTSLAQVVICSLAGYGFAKYQFPGRDVLFVAILSTFMIPLVAIVVPLYIFMRQLGWLNTYQGLIMPFAVSGFGVFLMRQYIMGIPDEYLDAARIDGAGELGIFRHVVFPIAVPAAGTLGLLAFVYAWNDFLWPLIVVSRVQYRTMMLGIAVFQSEYQTNFGELLAMATLSAVPLLIIFLLTQRRFIESVTMSGLKG